MILGIKSWLGSFDPLGKKLSRPEDKLDEWDRLGSHVESASVIG